MRLCQQVADDAGVVAERRSVDRVDGDSTLHVAELPDVVLETVDGRPAEQRITDRLQRLLVFDDTLSLVRMPCRITVNVSRQHRAPGLFELQEHYVIIAAAFEQGNVGPQADAAHADHLVRDVDQRVAPQYAAP